MFEEEFISAAPTQDKDLVRELLAKLTARYKEPHRFYHTLGHIETGLRTYKGLFPYTSLEPVKFFAWWYHDAVYDSTRSDNEELSAMIWWKDAPLLGFTMEEADEGVRYIQATEPSAIPISVINDMDLSELGTSYERFCENTDNIRKEYDWVEPEVWRKGRIALLIRFIKRDKLYVTSEFADKFTDQAIDNMKRAIIKLHQEDEGK